MLNNVQLHMRTNFTVNLQHLSPSDFPACCCANDHSSSPAVETVKQTAAVYTSPQSKQRGN